MLTIPSPFPVSELPQVWAWGEAYRERMSDYSSLRNLEAFMADWQEQERKGRRSWAVARNGELGGCLISTRLSPEVADIHLLFKFEFWGRATTLKALRMVCQELFADGVEKIETMADSRSALALAKAIGATRERILPGHTSRNGTPVDLVVLGLQRDTFLSQMGAS